MLWLTKCRYTDYTIYDFLDKTSLLKLMTINKTFLNHDEYFKHRIQNWAKYKPEHFCYRQWWKFLMVHSIPNLTNTKIFEFGLKNKLPTLVDYALCQPQTLSLSSVFDQALEFGRFDLIKQFHLSGADIFTLNHYPLRRASRKGYLDIIQYLIQHKANIHVNNDEPLRNAIYSGNREVINYLLDAGATMHYLTVEVIIDNLNMDMLRSIMNRSRVQQAYIIHHAIKYSVKLKNLYTFKSMILYIIEHGLPITNWLNQSLILASKWIAVDIFQYCLSCAKIYHLNIEDGLIDPFYICIQKGSDYLIEALIKFSPQLNSKIDQLIIDKLMSRLGEADYWDNPPVKSLIDFAIKRQIDITSCLNYGLIQKCCDLYWVKFFVRNGADVNYNNGQALQIATMNNQFCVVEYLRGQTPNLPF